MWLDWARMPPMAGRGWERGVDHSAGHAGGRVEVHDLTVVGDRIGGDLILSIDADHERARARRVMVMAFGKTLAVAFAGVIQVTLAGVVVVALGEALAVAFAGIVII